MSTEVGKGSKKYYHLFELYQEKNLIIGENCRQNDVTTEVIDAAYLKTVTKGSTT